MVKKSWLVLIVLALVIGSVMLCGFTYSENMDNISIEAENIKTLTSYKSTGLYGNVNNDIDNETAVNSQFDSSIIMPTGSSSVVTWHLGTGTSLPQTPNYEGYLFDLQVGDILYEYKRASSIGHHVAIVEGYYYDLTQRAYYWRVIEAFGGPSDKTFGVIRSVIDSERLEDFEGTILRVNSATRLQRQTAVNFCSSQLGKLYTWHFGEKPTSINTPMWMCSTLVWAAYKNQGFDLDSNSNDNDVMPNDILNSTLLKRVEHYENKDMSLDFNVLTKSDNTVAITGLKSLETNVEIP